MKKILMTTGIMLVSAFCLFEGRAAEKETVNWKKIAELGNGVHREKQDEKGNTKSFVAVGISRIRKALGEVDGEIIAQKRARLQAKAEIVKWLKGKVITYEASTGEYIISSTGNGDNVSESGKLVEKNIAKNEEYAEGIVRGTKVIYTGILRNGQMYVIILGWSAKNVKNARQVQAMMADESPLQKAPADKGKSPSSKGKKSNLVPDKETISDEAADY